MPISSNAVKIDGLQQLHRALKEISPEIRKQMVREFRGIASNVANDARDRMPERSGTAKRSVRASTIGGGAAVRGGGTRAPYYGWLDFGGHLTKKGKRHNSQYREKLKEGRYIYPAISRRRDDIRKAAESAVHRAKKAAGFW